MGPAADVALVDLAVVHGARLIGELLTHILGLRQHLAHGLEQLGLQT